MINTLKIYYSKITPNLFWSFASKAVAGIAFILIDILLARTLEPELYGKWQQFFSLLTLLLFIVYSGVPSATQAFTAQNLNKPELKRILIDSLALQIIFSSIATGLVLLLRDQIAGLIGQPDFSRFLLLAAPFLFIGALEEYLKNVYVGIKKTQYHFYMNIMSFGLRLVILAILFLFFVDIPGIILGYSSAIFVSVIVGLLLFRKQYLQIPKLEIPKSKYFKKIFLYSLPLAFSLFLNLSTSEINIQILGALADHTEVAYLGIGKQITSKLPQIAVAVAMGIMPDFAQITQENKQGMKKRLIGVLKINMLLYGFICGGIVLVSPILIPFIYGPSYSKAVLPLQILTVHLFMKSINVYLFQLISYHGKVAHVAKNLVSSFVLNIILSLILIPKFGATGSALALTLSFLPYRISVIRLASKFFKELK